MAQQTRVRHQPNPCCVCVAAPHPVGGAVLCAPLHNRDATGCKTATRDGKPVPYDGVRSRDCGARGRGRFLNRPYGVQCEIMRYRICAKPAVCGPHISCRKGIAAQALVCEGICFIPPHGGDGESSPRGASKRVSKGCNPLVGFFPPFLFNKRNGAAGGTSPVGGKTNHMQDCGSSPQ